MVSVAETNSNFLKLGSWGKTILFCDHVFSIHVSTQSTKRDSREGYKVLIWNMELRDPYTHESAKKKKKNCCTLQKMKFRNYSKHNVGVNLNLIEHLLRSPQNYIFTWYISFSLPLSLTLTYYYKWSKIRNGQNLNPRQEIMPSISIKRSHKKLDLHVWIHFTYIKINYETSKLLT